MLHTSPQNETLVQQHASDLNGKTQALERLQAKFNAHKLCAEKEIDNMNIKLKAAMAGQSAADRVRCQGCGLLALACGANFANRPYTSWDEKAGACINHSVCHLCYYRACVLLRGLIRATVIASQLLCLAHPPCANPSLGPTQLRSGARRSAPRRLWCRR